MTIERQNVDPSKFNPNADYPYSLREGDFSSAMQDVYDFLFDINGLMVERGLPRFDITQRPANMSGMLSDMLTASVARHSRGLAVNQEHNGHPDLLVDGKYPNNKVKNGEFGVEIKTTLKKGGQVDTHGARDQWLCVFVYATDKTTEPAVDRAPLRFTEIYLAEVTLADFRAHPRNTEIGTKTASLSREALTRFREKWIYLDVPPKK